MTTTRKQNILAALSLALVPLFASTAGAQEVMPRPVQPLCRTGFTTLAGRVEPRRDLQNVSERGVCTPGTLLDEGIKVDANYEIPVSVIVSDIIGRRLN